MPSQRSRFLLSLLFIPCLGGSCLRAGGPEPAVDYSRDVKPILAGRCYACHGPDEGKRKAKLRLDVRAEAIRKAIQPGHAAASPLIERVTSHEPTEVMPPPRARKELLTPREVAVLRQWIDQGAKFDTHWAYVKPVRPPLPEVADRAWPRNAVDFFVAAGHRDHGLRPAPEADRVTLLRRLSFDLTGLPPTPLEVEDFLQDSTAEAYNRVVDRLLASPHFGERMALYWLDLVRYGDTTGYHSDTHRNVSPYRDYVINAFNNDKPFDQFTVEQLAGDLLPNPTLEQKTASGYNRLLMTTEEGGGQAREYLAKYMADRVRNASVVWLASTMGCCECHNHKFDPFVTRDFYRLGAFFADLKETAVGVQEQVRLLTPEQTARVQEFDRQIAPLKETLGKQTPELEAAQIEWEKHLAEPAKDGSKPAGKQLPGDLAKTLALEPAKRTPEQKAALAAHFRGVTPLLEPVRANLARLEKQKEQYLQQFPQTLISQPVPPRMIRVLPRGNWLDDTGEVVAPGLPAFLAPESREGRLTRLDLARWLVARDNPLVARVVVNRLWKLCFGQGLVKTVDDFGTQGALPTHPQLLDWLAVEFMDSGWDVKHLLGLLVRSATYRQSSQAARELRERDPGNAWLARQGRFRLDAEMVRDNALAVSGLLNPRVGGASAKPYQPAGYWAYLNFPTREYVSDHGSELYRRGLYTYWQRTFLHPSLAAFDAPSREECTADRPRSSTPLQALVLLNDPIYVEAARVFAQRILREGGHSVPEKLDWAFRRALARGVRPAEVTLLSGLYQKHRDEYRADPEAARKLVATGEAPVPADLDPVELAAWTSVARVLLNLHETITRS